MQSILCDSAYSQPAGSEAGASSQTGTLGVLDVIRALALLIKCSKSFIKAKSFNKKQQQTGAKSYSLSG